MNEQMNRRAFFGRIAQIAGLAVIAPTVVSSIFSSKASAQEKRRGAAPAAGGALPLVDPNDSVAKAVKYVEDHNKAPESKGNHCSTCGFYAKKETRPGKGEVGTCTIFAGKVVVGNGWCASWNKKA
jgi:High potential iron-sulfur protein.